MTIYPVINFVLFLFFLGPVQTSIFLCTELIPIYPNDISSTVDSDVERIKRCRDTRAIYTRKNKTRLT